MESIALFSKLLVVPGLSTLFLPSMRDAWVEVLNEFVNNFRGVLPLRCIPPQ
jgi:hypothetical protein